jgi:hypothetical protein
MNKSGFAPVNGSGDLRSYPFGTPVTPRISYDNIRNSYYDHKFVSSPEKEAGPRDASLREAAKFARPRDAILREDTRFVPLQNSRRFRELSDSDNENDDIPRFHLDDDKQESTQHGVVRVFNRETGDFEIQEQKVKVSRFDKFKERFDRPLQLDTRPSATSRVKFGKLDRIKNDPSILKWFNAQSPTTQKRALKLLDTFVDETPAQWDAPAQGNNSDNLHPD